MGIAPMSSNVARVEQPLSIGLHQQAIAAIGRVIDSGRRDAERAETDSLLVLEALWFDLPQRWQ